jgi:hypothetical protein
MKSRFLRPVLAALLFVLASSQAQQPATDDQVVELPTWQAQNGISYVCGGVGADEAALMKKEAPKHDLMVTFADTNGEYLGDAHVTIADPKGRQLLDITCGGPVMLAEFPKSGRYRVQAEIGGRTAGGTVEVRHKAGVKTLPLVWPREPG